MSLNKNILNIDIQEFISHNLNSDVNRLILKRNIFPNVENKDLVEQIEAKSRCEKKLPSWFHAVNIYYPNKLNIEQTSSEIAAKYKSGLIAGKSLIDLTGGFGVDCFYFSKRFEKIIHCEIDKRLSEIATHNYEQLSIKNLQTVTSDGIEFLENKQKQYDWIYADPSRRHDSKGKVFFLKDCLPNVPSHLDLLFKYSNNILLKTSPLLDLSSGISEIKHVKAIHVVAVNNEVKELLWVLEKEYNDNITVRTVNLKTKSEEYFEFSLDNEKEAIVSYSEPLTYLYEPNSAVLKSGAFNLTSQKLKVDKLHKHSHLYTSNTVIDFPGRVFKISSVLPYKKKVLKKLGISQANITFRNFSGTVQQIREKFNIQDGGDVYLFFTTTSDENKVILVTKKLT